MVQYHGALGAVIIDNGDCTGYNQQCLPGADKRFGEGFGKNDFPNPW